MRAAHAAASAALTARSAAFTGRSVTCAPAKPAMAPRHPRGSARASLDASVADGVILSITSTIKYGAPLYNKGEAKECAALYRQAALSIVRDPMVASEPIKKRLRDAVAEAERIKEGATEDRDMTEQRMHEKSAWALRAGWMTTWTCREPAVDGRVRGHETGRRERASAADQTTLQAGA